MDQWNNELEPLFGQYKRLVPDQDPSANFMPDLWRKIEARQSLVAPNSPADETLRGRRLGDLRGLCAVHGRPKIR